MFSFNVGVGVENELDRINFLASQTIVDMFISAKMVENQQELVDLITRIPDDYNWVNQFNSFEDAINELKTLPVRGRLAEGRTIRRVVGGWYDEVTNNYEYLDAAYELQGMKKAKWIKSAIRADIVLSDMVDFFDCRLTTDSMLEVERRLKAVYEGSENEFYLAIDKEFK